jgi:hypothetical protein
LPTGKINFPDSRYTLSNKMKKYGYTYKEIRKNNKKDYYWMGLKLKE